MLFIIGKSVGTTTKEKIQGSTLMHEFPIYFFCSESIFFCFSGENNKIKFINGVVLKYNL